MFHNKYDERKMHSAMTVCGFKANLDNISKENEYFAFYKHIQKAL